MRPARRRLRWFALVSPCATLVPCLDCHINASDSSSATAKTSRILRGVHEFATDGQMCAAR